ncbi:MAG: enoyl-CoA hydratase/isomerase family protein [Deltaproteobacteria bacterium]|nr:enoyl-CoA hydratase/isomerase family protein [Deltaproteobacteria bacterium]MBW2359636.1 enoyl-CoA hydratase/isomerase family protein [Deltaproteobacteria bacterium]
MTIHYKVADHVAEIEIEGIGEHNLFSPDDVYIPLAETFREFRDDPEAWCALVHAPEDRTAFTYGGHLKAMDKVWNEEEADRGYRLPSGFDRVFRPDAPSDDVFSWSHLLELDGSKIYKPMVFAVAGPCYGAGTLLVDANADYVVAAPETRFGLVEMRWGQGSFASGVVRSLPWRIAMDMALRGRIMESEEALRLGFVNAVVPKSEVLAEARRIVADFASMPPLHAQMSKRLAILGREHPDHLMQAMRDVYYAAQFSSADSKEGVRAFVEKRKPVYTGKPE